MSGGLKGPLSPLQELEVGGCRPPYLLVCHIACVMLSPFCEQCPETCVNFMCHV